MDCNCPDDGILEEIADSTCSFDMKQIQRIAFANRGKVIFDSATGGGAGNGVPTISGQVDTLADWQVLRSAVDATKVVITPLIGGDPVIAAGEAISEGGGDNTTLNGITDILGTNPSNFTATFKSITPEQERGLKAISCKTTEVYFFLEGGKIACYKYDGTDERCKGFLMQSYFFSDRNNNGFGTKDTHTMSFSLVAGWSENLIIVKPADFNPIYDL